jgi:hypothetical protein
MVRRFIPYIWIIDIDFAIDGHYLNLPVMNEGGEIVGMVDVLKLTYATLEQVCSTVTLEGMTY